MHSSSTKSKLITDDIIIIILKYLPPNDLLRAIESSKSWFSAASKDSNRIWRIHAENIWKQSGMTVNVPSGDLSLLARIKRIPLPTLKRSLQRVDITRCVEKIDFQRMLMANLLFGGRSSESCAKLRIYYPDWALKVDEYKAAYFHGKRDVKRTQIHMSELCAIGWIFYFKTEFGYDEEVSSSPSKFRNDFTYYSERFGQTYYWQVFERDHFPFPTIMTRFLL